MQIYLVTEVGEVYSFHRTREGAEKRIEELLKAHIADSATAKEDPYLTREDYQIRTGELED